MTMPDSMLDLLDHGCDGEPRWVTLDALDAHAAATLVRLIAAEAERRGYVPLAVDNLPAFVRTLPEEMRHRTLALLHTHDARTPPDGSALLVAASLNPRPHVLVTIAVGGPASAAKAAMARHGRPACTPLLREARTAYAADREAPASVQYPDNAKYVARAHQAFALARLGRHEPALRMLREAAAALARRRDAFSAATAMTLLGRVLLERGRAEDASATFAEAVTQLDPVQAADAAIARVWMARARTDAGRLTEAEGLLRATSARWRAARRRPAEVGRCSPGALSDLAEPIRRGSTAA